MLEKNFDSGKYWELRYKYNWDSGDGSYGESSEIKSKIFNDLLKDYGVENVIEFGCGDGNQLLKYNIKHYLGLDVSRVTIKNIIKKFESDKSKSFMWYDPQCFQVSSHFFKSEASISVDVIFHLVEDSVFVKYMNDLFDSSNNYVFIYATNFDDAEKPVAHLRNRKFTDWVEKNRTDWNLEEVRDSKADSGKRYLSWYIYKKKS